jgi:hypothetical protein
VISALLVAILTDSGLIIDWNLNSKTSNKTLFDFIDFDPKPDKLSVNRQTEASLLSSTMINSSWIFYRLLQQERQLQNRSNYSKTELFCPRNSACVKRVRLRSDSTHKWRLKKNISLMLTPKNEIKTDKELSLSELESVKTAASLNDLLTVKSKLKSSRSVLLFFVFQTNAAHFFEYCAQPRFYSVLLKYKLVSPKLINQVKSHLIDSNSKNSSFDETNEMLERVLQIGFQAGSRLLKRFWRPNESMQRLVSDYQRLLFSHVRNDSSNIEKPNYKYFIIGLQLRMQFLEHPLDTLRFVSCAIQLENEQIELFKLKNGHEDASNLRFKWFVTSDTTHVISQLRQNYTTVGKDQTVSVGNRWRQVVSVTSETGDNNLNIGHTLYNSNALNRFVDS